MISLAKIYRSRRWRIAFFSLAAFVIMFSLYVGEKMVQELTEREESYMQIWSHSMRTLLDADDNTDLSLVLHVINTNNNIPVIACDADGNILAARNVGIPQQVIDAALSKVSLNDEKQRDGNTQNTIDRLHRCLEKMNASGRHMELTSTYGTPENRKITIVYSTSTTLRQLSLYPYVLWAVISFFLLFILLAIWSSRRAEQNLLWVGLSRETAHQLGTPISSLLAASEYIKMEYPDEPLLPEVDKDIHRLQLIADRFSKIGTPPELSKEDFSKVVESAVDYMRHRISRRIEISLSLPATQVPVMMSAELMEWVVENLCKNAVDAMPVEGKIRIWMILRKEQVFLYVSDTGKGMSKRKRKQIFKPGFTTKKRGWGLGLSLSKRIVEDFHKGKIFVENSEENVGTTFCIVLKREDNE